MGEVWRARDTRLGRSVALNIGQRNLWKEIHPARPVDEVYNLVVTPDGRAYAYNFAQAISDLYLVQRLR